jgi:hypothetical protein
MAVKRFVASKAPNSILHEEVHPGLTYSLVAIGAFFAGAILLGALSVHATIDPASSAEVRMNDIFLELQEMNERVERIEASIGMKTGDVQTDAQACDRLESALPTDGDDMERVPDSAACFETRAIQDLNQTFPSASAIYRRADADAEEVTVEIYDFKNHERAGAFLAENGYLPINPGRVERENVTINGYAGVFTHEGLLDGSGYVRGANRLVIAERYGIIVHGPAVGLTDRGLLNDVTRAVRTDALEAP